jgi:hypothetical protein
MKTVENVIGSGIVEISVSFLEKVAQLNFSEHEMAVLTDIIVQVVRRAEVIEKLVDADWNGSSDLRYHRISRLMQTFDKYDMEYDEQADADNLDRELWKCLNFKITTNPDAAARNAARVLALMNKQV